MATPRDTQVDIVRRAVGDAGGLAHRIRVAIIGLIALRLVLFAGHEMLDGVFKHWMTMGFLLAGALASGVIARGHHSSGRRTPWLMASTLLDATLATLVILPSVVWPRETFLGVLRAPDVLIFPIVAAGAGLRMTRAAALTGALGAVGGLGTLVAIDLSLNFARVRYGFGEILLAMAIMVGATFAALGTVRFVEGLLVRTAEQTLEAQRVRNQLGAYVAHEFADIVLDHPGLPEPRRARVAVLFSDLRGFTTYSEGRDPQDLVAELNAYLTAMVHVIHAHGGVVDKYIGDAIMAVFGLPEADGTEADRALGAAAAMTTALTEHNAARAARGLPPLAQGVGVHYGEVTAGPVGTEERLQFTVLGDTVNVAARLESATKGSGHAVLVSDALRSAVGDADEVPTLVPGPELELRGRSEPVSTWVLPAVSPARSP